MELNEEKVFKDNVHGYIHVNDKLIWDLIETKEFQRLRRIHQLGCVFTTFHTAEHSRFSHSLGVYEIARRIIDEVEDINLTDDERLITLCSALLHDLGHGPFSHTFESVFNVKHEDFTVKTILGDTEINKVLRNYNEDFPKYIAEVIEKKYKKQLMISIISSQIDADRLDYLLRDSYNTGVLYGKIDLNRILRIIKIVDNQIVFKESGLREIENYIISRYHMYWQVYFHPTSRACDIILINILKRAKELYNQNYIFIEIPTLLIPIFENKITVLEYLELDESVVVHYIKQFIKESDTILSDLSDRFINRKLYKYSEYESEKEILSIYNDLKELLKIENIETDYYLKISSTSKSPYEYYSIKNMNNQSIKIVNKKGDVKELTEVSQMVKSIVSTDKLVDYILFYPKEFIDNIPDSNNKTIIKDLLRIK